MDIEKAHSLEIEINEKRNSLRQQHVEDLKEKKYKHKIGAFYSDLFSINERIGDYIINVTEAIEEYQDTKIMFDVLCTMFYFIRHSFSEGGYPPNQPKAA